MSNNLTRTEPQYKTFKCLVFPTGGSRIRTFVASIDHDQDDQYVWAEDLQLSYLFPLGRREIRLSLMPFTRLPLRNHLIVIYSADQTSSLPNSCIAKLFDEHWLGNVVVLKCSQKDSKQIIQMDWGDKSLVDMIISMYVIHRTYHIPPTYTIIRCFKVAMASPSSTQSQIYPTIVVVSCPIQNGDSELTLRHLRVLDCNLTTRNKF